MTVRYRLLIEYDGTPFQGWQVQERARTVQGVLEEAAYALCREKVEIQGASRTDAGVHAIGQVAHMDLKKRWPEDKIRFGLNDHLPATVNVLAVTEVPRSFHARRDAKEKTYLYCLSRERTAFAKKYVWWVKDHLDVEKMSRAANLYVGCHDFSSFADKRLEASSSRRVMIRESKVKEHGSLVLFQVTGSHFLWKMVRRMMGILVEIGRGNLSLDIIPDLLKSPSSLPARFTAPPSGLFLAFVRYEGEERKEIPWPPWGVGVR
ncbi:MAG TPA: tRNA pseudouridine(38-40) synthase TruA [Syntrophales bacterium]|nr:tRNA pseudouridine(38-40) synthase TruA [Syntrophales bacterium]HOL60061.1 tRNA pseudouridine(38-40) synthase TruA [Syntrophales bacterium]HPO36171.1 tRNA pseudouridine(38-40) synthase TruA [Syntrophales bacterium]